MVVLKHQITGVRKQVPIGFSWTNFFFGVFVPLIRGDIKNALIQGVLAFITWGFSWLVFPFFYNNTYIKDLLMKGFVPADEHSKRVLQKKGLYIPPTENITVM